MDINEQYFIDLLSAFVNKTQPVEILNADWKQIIHLAKLHSVSGILGYMAGKLPESNRPNSETIKSMHDSMYNTVIMFTKRAYAMQQLMKQFEEYQIPCLLMKGYLIRQYYPVPELRTFGDIDFLVKPEDRERSHELMTKLGYELSESSSAVWSYKKGFEYYEIHTHILSDIRNLNDSYVTYLNDVWKYAIPFEGEYIFQLSPEFHFIYLFLHMSKHFAYSGAGVRMFLDLVLMAKNDPKLDNNYISSELKTLGIYTFACAISELCHRWFNVKLPIVDEGKLNDISYLELSDYILSGGVFGFNGRDSGMPLLRAEYCKGATSNKSARLKTMWKYFFPSYSQMKQAYTFLDGKPFLLPVGWAVRIAKNICRGKFNKVEKQIETINSSDDEEAKKQYELFNSIGLADVFKGKIK